MYLSLKELLGVLFGCALGVLILLGISFKFSLIEHTTANPPPNIELVQYEVNLYSPEGKLVKVWKIEKESSWKPEINFGYRGGITKLRWRDGFAVLHSGIYAPTGSRLEIKRKE